MRIHMYGTLWNEAHLLPYFFRHYDPFIERYILYDNGSDDGSLEILKSHPRVELRFPPTNLSDSACEFAMTYKAAAWKDSRGRADLVLVCDIDEFIYHPKLEDFLTASIADGVTMFVPQGWSMVADDVPTSAGQLYDTVRIGFRDRYFDKPCLFNPNTILEMNYTVGCHKAFPTGKVRQLRHAAFRLLHFRYFGAEWTANRYAALNELLRAGDRRKGYGRQYTMTASQIRKMLKVQTLFDVIDACDASV